MERSRVRKTRIRVALLGAGTLALSVALHFGKHVDFAIQSLLRPNGHWLVDAAEPVGRFFFYRFGRALPWIVAALVLARAIRASRTGEKPWSSTVRACAFLALLPVTIAALKAVTGQPCPDGFAAFGGSIANEVDYWRGARCFPAGHASAGFALIGAAFLATRPRTRFRIALAASIWGWILGIYQMAKGAHFLSDTLATCGFAALYYAILVPSRNAGPSQTSPNSSP